MADGNAFGIINQFNSKENAAAIPMGRQSSNGSRNQSELANISDNAVVSIGKLNPRRLPLRAKFTSRILSISVFDIFTFTQTLYVKRAVPKASVHGRRFNSTEPYCGMRPRR